MEPIEIVGQAIGMVATCCGVLSFQQKKQSRLVACQLMASLLFSINFFLLGAIMGGFLNVLSVIRAVVFLFEKKLNATHPAWLFAFTLCFITFYVLSFTVFGTEPTPINFIMEILPVIGMTALSVAFMLNNSKKSRKLGLISSPSWLIYNIYHFSIGAIICEVLSLCSIFIGMFRHDRIKKQ